MRYIIIGSGIAGVTAAQTIREHDSLAEILVYTNEIHPFGLYSRKDMARHLADGSLSEETILVTGEAALAQRRIKLLYLPIERIFPRTKQILVAHAARKGYDRLLLAVGATPRLVDAPGLHYIGVHQARQFEDFSLIEAWMPQLQEAGAVVIGGGILALDMTYALNRRGVPTTLVVRESQIGWPLLPQGAAHWLEERLRRDGIELILGETVSAYLSADGRMLDGVQLSSGRVLPARMALCAVGVQPSTDFLEGSGIALDSRTDAIQVNAQMQTTMPDVYAAGSCAVFNGQVARNWQQSSEQGRIAALNMLGQSVNYQPDYDGDLSTQIYGLPLAYFGQVTPAAADTWVWTDGQSGFAQIWLEGNRIVGATLVGETQAADQLLAWYRARAVVNESDLKALLATVGV